MLGLIYHIYGDIIFRQTDERDKLKTGRTFWGTSDTERGTYNNAKHLKRSNGDVIPSDHQMHEVYDIGSLGNGKINDFSDWKNTQAFVFH